MKKIEIETRYDEHMCESCGWDSAVGGIVKIDDEIILDVEPIAYCYDGVSYNENDLLVLALHELGIEVLVDGGKYHINQSTKGYNI